MSTSVTRTSSFQAPSRTVSASFTASSQSSMSTEHTTRFSHKLKHMFDQQRFSVFEPTVVIDEIDSLVGPKGSVVCDYKFRGKAIKERDFSRTPSQSNVPSPRPSMPNLKLSALNGSTSSLSLKSHPTLPGPRAALGSSRLGPASPEKSKTLPPALPSSSPAVPTLHSARKHDPTPLRQSIGPELQKVASPEPIVAELGDEPEPLEVESEDRRMSVPSVHSGLGSSAFTGSTRTSLSNGSGEPMSGRSASGLPPSISVRAPSVSSSLAATPTAAFPKLSDVHAQGRRLDVPLARAGTVASPLTLLGRLPSRETYAKMIRHEDLGEKPDASGTGAPDDQPKQEGQPSHPGPPPTLTHRKGITQRAPIKGTTVRIMQRLTPGPIRIPLGDPIMPPPLPGLASPSRMQRPRPRLGEGSLSESGVKLEFWLYPAAKNEPRRAESKDDAPGTSQDQHRAPPRERLGHVNFDLAPFAGFGKGQHTRSYLLKECTVNASVRVTVTMKQVGGEDLWAAPPDETHFTSDLSDLVGSDLGDQLHQHGTLRTDSPSGSDDESDISSAGASSLAQAPAASISSMSRPTQSRYKSFQHHLRPDAQSALGHGRPAHLSMQSIPASSSSSSPSSPRATTPRSASPASPMIEAKAQEEFAAASSQSQLFQKLHHHPHHTRHLRHGVEADHTIFPNRPNHGMSARSHELAPETVIEAVFNPHAAKTEGPFTFVPEGEQARFARLASEDAIVDELAQESKESGTDGDVKQKGVETGQQQDEGGRHAEGPQKSEGARRRWLLGRRREASERAATLAV